MSRFKETLRSKIKEGGAQRIDKTDPPIICAGTSAVTLLAKEGIEELPLSMAQEELKGIVIEDCEIDKDSSRETEEIASRLENLFS